MEAEDMKKIQKLKEILSDDISQKELLTKLKNGMSDTESLITRCKSLNVLGFIYFLYPNIFNKFSESETLLIRNPIKRIEYLKGIKIDDTNTLEEFNYLIEDQYIYEANKETLENTHFPIMIDEQDWKIEIISTGNIGRFNLMVLDGIWKIESNGHGHFRENYQDLYLSTVVDELELIFIKIEF